MVTNFFVQIFLWWAAILFVCLVILIITAWAEEKKERPRWWKARG